MVDQGIWVQSPRIRTSWGCQLWDSDRRMSSSGSSWVDKPGFNHLRQGYGSVYGGGSSQMSLLDAATNILKIYTMSPTMARQGDRVQLEQSDMCLALNMAKMANGGFSRAAMEETQYLIKTPCTEVWEEMKWGDEFPGHMKKKAAIERHMAMLRQNHINGCLPFYNGTTKNPPTRCRWEGTGSPRPDRQREPTPELTPSPPETPPALPGDNDGAQSSQIDFLPPGYDYLHAPLPSTQFSNLDG